MYIQIFIDINRYHNFWLVSTINPLHAEVQRSLHGAVEATQRGQHPGETRGVKAVETPGSACDEPKKHGNNSGFRVVL